MDRTIQIENYLPSVVREVDVFQQIAKAQNPEFNLLKNRIVQTFSERFVQTASEYGVRRWESLLLIPVDETLTLQQRKERVLTCLNIKTPYTWRMLENMLGAYLGEGNFSLTYNIEENKLLLKINWLSSYARRDIESLFKKVLPVNVVFEIKYFEDSKKISIDVPIYFGGDTTINRVIYIK